MNIKLITVLSIAIAGFAALTTSYAAAKTTKPNIVFILADDLGWADVAYNGHPFNETPNIDKLIQAGMKFDRAYAGGPNCLPMRSCLISGMYTPRTQIWNPGGKSKGENKFMKFDVPSKGKKSRTIPSKIAMEPSVTSIAEVLKTAGYTTARFGKWHVGKDTQGFDISDPNGKGGKIGRKFYGNINVAEWLTDASVKFIEDNKEGPFFLYLSHWDVHAPIRARKDVVDKFQRKFDGQKEWTHDWNVPFAAMLEAADVSVGRVRAKLKELGLEENTLFIFSSDNGGPAGITISAPLKGAKGAFFEGGVRVPTAMVWPAVIKPKTVCDTPITSVDFMPTFAEMAGAKLPQNQPVDGKSFTGLLKGEDILKDRSIFWHFPLYLLGVDHGRVVPVFGTNELYWRATPSSMIMNGDWKLIHFFEDNSIQLYNVKKDIGEKYELSKSNPEMAKKLFEELKTWQKETKAVIPTVLNKSFDSSGDKSQKASKPKRKPNPKS